MHGIGSRIFANLKTNEFEYICLDSRPLAFRCFAAVQNPAYRFALINNKLKFEYFANDKPMNANYLFANIFLTFAIIRIYETIRTAF